MEAQGRTDFKVRVPGAGNAKEDRLSPAIFPWQYPHCPNRPPRCARAALPVSSMGDNRNNLYRQHPSFAAQRCGVFITAHGCARKNQTLSMLFSETYPHVHSRASAGGGFAYNFSPQQGVDCLWTQRRGERRGVGEKMESVKGWHRCLKLSVLSPIIRGQL